MNRVAALVLVTLVLVSVGAWADIPNGTDVQVNDSSGDGATYTFQAGAVVARDSITGDLAAVWTDSTGYYATSDHSLVGFGYSDNDGGAWNDQDALAPGTATNLWGFVDAVADPDGNMFIATLGGDSGTGIYVAKSVDGGQSYALPVAAHAGTMDDKPLMAVDLTDGTYSGNLYVAYLDFNESGFNIFVTTSSDGGASFATPVNVCAACGAETHQGPIPAVGADGKLYVAWAVYDTWPPTQSQMKIARSDDGGATFNTPVTVNPAAALAINATATTACSRPALKENIRNYNFPGLAVDPSGYVHLVFTQKGGGSDEADIAYTKSEDEGATWSSPVKLNDDSSLNDQFYPTIVANPNGILTAYWYDRREDINDEEFKIYQTRSLDGGDTWSADQAVSDVSSPVYTSAAGLTACYMGDYNRAVADEDYFYLIWGDNRNEQNGHPDNDIWFERRPVCDNQGVAIEFDPPGGTYSDAVEVDLSFAGDDPNCPSEGEIYYTTDGSAPTTSSTPYTAPIEVTDSLDIRVLAFTCCDQEMAPITESYVISPGDDDTSDDDTTDDDTSDDDVSDDDSGDDTGDDDDDDSGDDSGDDDSSSGDDDDDSGCCGC